MPLEILNTHFEKLGTLRSMEMQQDKSFMDLKERRWGKAKSYIESLN